MEIEIEYFRRPKMSTENVLIGLARCFEKRNKKYDWIDTESFLRFARKYLPGRKKLVMKYHEIGFSYGCFFIKLDGNCPKRTVLHERFRDFCRWCERGISTPPWIINTLKISQLFNGKIDVYSSENTEILIEDKKETTCLLC